MKTDRLTEYLSNLPTDVLVAVHNEYCWASNYCDDEIFYMDCFDEIMSSLKPFELACRTFYGDFNPNRYYFYFNNYGNLESTDFPRDRIYISDIVDYIIENDNELDDEGIREILDEYQEEEEDELI